MGGELEKWSSEAFEGLHQSLTQVAEGLDETFTNCETQCEQHMEQWQGEHQAAYRGAKDEWQAAQKKIDEIYAQLMAVVPQIQSANEEAESGAASRMSG